MLSDMPNHDTLHCVHHSNINYISFWPVIKTASSAFVKHNMQFYFIVE